MALFGSFPPLLPPWEGALELLRPRRGGGGGGGGGVGDYRHDDPRQNSPGRASRGRPVLLGFFPAGGAERGGRM